MIIMQNHTSYTTNPQTWTQTRVLFCFCHVSLNLLHVSSICEVGIQFPTPSPEEFRFMYDEKVEQTDSHRGTLVGIL